MPVLCMFFSEADLKPAFRLSRDTINVLVQMLPRQKPHGWSHEIEVAGCLSLLACMWHLIQSDSRHLHHTKGHSWQSSAQFSGRDDGHPSQDYSFPQARRDGRRWGAVFARLAGHEAFRCAAGVIDGCHIRILSPAEPQK